jgi:hypothetical protein
MHVEVHPSITHVTMDAIRFYNYHRSSQSKGLPNMWSTIVLMVDNCKLIKENLMNVVRFVDDDGWLALL